eukprot:6866469-Prymnesium_polylepis.1
MGSLALEALWLSFCSVSRWPETMLAYLRADTSLRRLEIRFNKQRSHLRHLCTALADHPALTALNLRRTWLGPHYGGSALAGLMRGRCPLSSLELRNNKLYARGVTPLLRVLSGSDGLKPLEMPSSRRLSEASVFVADSSGEGA